MDYQLLSDVALTKKIQKKDDNIALETLISRHGALANDILTKFTPALVQSGVCLQDVYNEKDMAFYKAAKSFNPDKKVKVSTWLANYIRYLCLRFIHHQGKNQEISVEDITNVINKETSYDCPDNFFCEEVLHVLENMNNKNVAKVFKMRYFGGPKKGTFKEIADELGVSVQTAKNWSDQGLEYLRENLEVN
jgi:RNA polymerase sigma factor (sigma-70 family)